MVVLIIVKNFDSRVWCSRNCELINPNKSYFRIVQLPLQWLQAVRLVAIERTQKARETVEHFPCLVKQVFWQRGYTVN